MNTIEKFYEAFARQDAEAMVLLYHDEVWFADPAFGQLKGDRAKNMWRMLIASQKGKSFKVVVSNIHCDSVSGSADWEAVYTFGSKKRKIHNKIKARFKLQDGKIISHLDEFNVHHWATQAMGFSGWLIGWTAYFKKKLRFQTNGMLDRFEKNQKSN